MTQVHIVTGGLERGQTQQQERQTEEEVAHVAAFLHVDEDNTDEEGWIDHARDVERSTQGHDPSRQRGTDVGTHNH